ncbi:MAG: hypothetical protein KatS3mg072_1104 [Meiothermus sp.]|nr:MAG: hypothetical protein KatS3mg072_1104 [Meiothermus sp.]GIW36273.1 MAG: hypothetical protein KatS3mg073_0418 [Meiothermus sp.]GIW38934.1 MAG: hypothetical protein KatS3mg075_415 [Meiothermus sp.]
MAENTQANDMRKLASAQNPLQVVQNPIVVSTSLGVLGAYWLRKTLYTQRRDIFGWADRKDGRVVYWQVGKDGKPIVGKENQNAYTSRIVFNLAGVLLGTILINNNLIEDATADYIGLGVAAGSFANLVMTLFQID